MFGAKPKKKPDPSFYPLVKKGIAGGLLVNFSWGLNDFSFFARNFSLSMKDFSLIVGFLEKFFRTPKEAPPTNLVRNPNDVPVKLLAQPITPKDLTAPAFRK